MQGDFEGDVHYDRRWRHEFADGQVIEVQTDWESAPENEQLASALAAAVGWPSTSARMPASLPQAEAIAASSRFQSPPGRSGRLPSKSRPVVTAALREPR